MKTLLISIIIYFIFNSNLFPQWIKQLSPNHPIRDIEFIDRYTGWACGDNYIYKTTDGGLNWIQQPNPAVSLIQQIFPLNKDTVYACGYWTILKTTNGGENWIGIRAGGPNSGFATLEGLHFINEQTGWLCGSVTIMKTTNGCQTFDSARIDGDMHDIYFKDSLNGVMVGEGIIFKTTNGGVNWKQANINSVTYRNPFLYRVSFINGFTGFTCGFTNVVFRTTDFGSNWDSIGHIDTINSLVTAYCIEFADSLVGYAGGLYGKLSKTTDGGITWKDQYQSVPGYVRSIYAYSDSIVWICGFRKILFTETGGQVNINLISTTIHESFKLHQNYPNPFNPKTKIRFEIRKTELIKLVIYDNLGRVIKEIVNKKLEPGLYKAEWYAENNSSGVYYYTLYSENFKETKRMVLVK